jgi:putative ATPase
MKELDYGGGYRYAHDYPGNFAEQEFLPERLSEHRLYSPQDNPAERKLGAQLGHWWKGKYQYGESPEKERGN